MPADKIHPEARELLPDPYFWDTRDVLSPHGNRIGALALKNYLRLSEGSKDGVFDAVFGGGMADIAGDGLDEEGLTATSNPVRMSTELAIGTAFAEVKVFGCISEEHTAAVVGIMRLQLESDENFFPGSSELQRQAAAYTKLEEALFRVTAHCRNKGGD